MNDYLDQKTIYTLYITASPQENFEGQILEKQANYDDSNRVALVSVLQKQYAPIETSHLTQQNIEALKVTNTFTVTTGHQLNYLPVLYISYIKSSPLLILKELKAKYPSYNFVPIYWMATEDHDFEEINYFNFKGRKFRWNKESTGPVEIIYRRII
jgi:uncharacterized protein YllA (UPF0747 family)